MQGLANKCYNENLLTSAIRPLMEGAWTEAYMCLSCGVQGACLPKGSNPKDPDPQTYTISSSIEEMDMGQWGPNLV